MRKIKTSQNRILRKKKRIRVGRKGNKKVIAAEWVDIELIENINLRIMDNSKETGRTHRNP